MIPRELIKGTLKYMVLNLLQKQSKMYGYEITQVLDKKPVLLKYFRWLA
jgi:DNA-binding PadR family transcriptional regulator